MHSLFPHIKFIVHKAKHSKASHMTTAASFGDDLAICSVYLTMFIPPVLSVKVMLLFQK